jgi:hypothetical protein
MRISRTGPGWMSFGTPSLKATVRQSINRIGKMLGGQPRGGKTIGAGLPSCRRRRVNSLLSNAFHLVRLSLACQVCWVALGGDCE